MTPVNADGSDSLEHGEMTFEDAIERLETIADALDAGQVSLEESIALFEEGMGLVKRCSERLNRAEGRIEELIRVNEETLKTQPLDVDVE